jgi:hypothetical protein
MTRASRLLLASVIGLALLLRVWGVTFGLPYDLTADEPHQIVQALKVGAGQGGPLVRMWHTVGKGGLDYLLFVEYSLLFAGWWLIGQVHGPREFALRYLTDPTAFYLVGRVTVAALGALTALAVFHVGRRMFDVRIGLGAATIAAVSYFHASASHVINVHVPMACALWTGVAAYLSYEASGTRRLLVIAGLLSGAAVALAYSAAVGLAMLVFARLFLSDRADGRVRDAAILGGTALLSIAFMSPDLLTGAGMLLRNFAAPAAATATGGDLRGAIDSVTILQQHDWTAFLQLWLKPGDLLITIAAAAGLLIGVWKRERWTILLSGTTAIYVLVVSASHRGLSESYLLPVIPAVWLLSSRGLAALSLGRRSLYAAGVTAACSVPLFYAVREDVMLAKPDTRVIAKQWIETHVPAGSKILMDGMRFRFVQGVPLNPDRTTVARRLASLEKSELVLSADMLSLYREAADRIDGPTYELHSTMYGLEVDDLDTYVRSCFSYIVVSSFNEKRYATDAARQRHPKSARFYHDIKSDPRFQVVYEVRPGDLASGRSDDHRLRVTCEGHVDGAERAS